MQPPKLPTMPSSAAPVPCHGPRERLQLYGADSLSDSDLVALVLGTGGPGEPVSVLAARLLAESGGLRALSAPGFERMRGLGPGKACRLRAALELGIRAAAEPLQAGRPIRNSRDVHAAVGLRLQGRAAEHFLAIAVDAKNRPLRQILVALGGLTSCSFTPADAFRPVLREAAAGVVFVHNHPSGEPSPSDDDVAMTRRLCATGRLVGLPVLDHIIVAGERYFSFLDAGLLDTALLDTNSGDGGHA